MHQRLHSDSWKIADIHDFDSFVKSINSSSSTGSRIFLGIILMVSGIGLIFNSVAVKKLFASRHRLARINVRYLITMCAFDIFQLSSSFLLFGKQILIVLFANYEFAQLNKKSNETSIFHKILEIGHMPAPILWILYRAATLSEVWFIVIYTYYRYKAISQPITAIIHAIRGEKRFKFVVFSVCAIALGISICKEAQYLGWEKIKNGELMIHVDRQGPFWNVWNASMLWIHVSLLVLIPLILLGVFNTVICGALP